MSLSPVMVLIARAEARALLFDAGEFACLDEALEPLLLFAHDRGLDGATACNIILTAFEGRGDEFR